MSTTVSLVCGRNRLECWVKSCYFFGFPIALRLMYCLFGFGAGITFPSFIFMFFDRNLDVKLKIAAGSALEN